MRLLTKEKIREIYFFNMTTKLAYIFVVLPIKKAASHKLHNYYAESSATHEA